jgi:hypothetical protein
MAYRIFLETFLVSNPLSDGLRHMRTHQHCPGELEERRNHDSLPERETLSANRRCEGVGHVLTCHHNNFLVRRQVLSHTRCRRERKMAADKIWGIKAFWFWVFHQGKAMDGEMWRKAATPKSSRGGEVVLDGKIGIPAQGGRGGGEKKDIHWRLFRRTQRRQRYRRPLQSTRTGRHCRFRACWLVRELRFEARRIGGFVVEPNPVYRILQSHMTRRLLMCSCFGQKVLPQEKSVSFRASFSSPKTPSPKTDRSETLFRSQRRG